MKTSKRNLIMILPIMIVLAVSLVLGVMHFSVSQNASHAGLNAISSTSMSISNSSTVNTESFYANNISYSTIIPRVPSGSQVRNAFSGYVDFLQIDQVKKFTNFLVEGKVLGFVNSTPVYAGFSGVQTQFVFLVQDSLNGTISPGQKILISQQGGVAQLANGTYVNGTLTNYPLLKINATYVLALSLTPSSKLLVLGPNAVFPVINGTVYPSEPDTPFPTSGCTLSQFFQIWSQSFGYTSTTGELTGSSSSCIATISTETVTAVKSTGNQSETAYTTFATTFNPCG